MTLKENIEQLLIDLKELGWTRRKLEKELGYSEKYIDQQISKGGNKRLLEGLKKVYDSQSTITLINRNVISERDAFYERTLDQSISDHEQRLLRIEAHLEVFESAIAGLLSKENNTDFIKKVGELRSAVQEVVRRKIDELKLKP